MVFLNAGGGFWALKRLERKAGTPIRGTFLPLLFQPAFALKNVNAAWKDRFQVVSGNLWVHYDPLSLLPGRSLRIQVEGSDLKVRLSGDLLQSHGLSELRVEHVRADFALSDEGEPEIFLFEVDSPELQFHFAEKEGPSI